MKLKYIAVVAALVAAAPSVEDLAAFEAFGPTKCEYCEDVVHGGSWKHYFTGEPCAGIVIIKCRDCTGGGDGGCHHDDQEPVIGLCAQNPNGHPACGSSWENLAAVEAAAEGGDLEMLAVLIQENPGSVQIAAEGYAISLDCQGRVVQATRIALANPGEEEAV